MKLFCKFAAVALITSLVSAYIGYSYREYEDAFYRGSEKSLGSPCDTNSDGRHSVYCRVKSHRHVEAERLFRLGNDLMDFDTPPHLPSRLL